MPRQWNNKASLPTWFVRDSQKRRCSSAVRYSPKSFFFWKESVTRIKDAIAAVQSKSDAAAIRVAPHHVQPALMPGQRVMPITQKFGVNIGFSCATRISAVRVNRCRAGHAAIFSASESSFSSAFGAVAFCEVNRGYRIDCRKPAPQRVVNH